MSDGNVVRAYTVRLELVDEPGELLNALGPIAEHGGNLLSIFHERGNRTPRGRIPVEVDLEATTERFDRIVDALRETGVNVVQAGAERYSEELTVLLIGHLVETDFSDTLSRFETCASASVDDVSLTVADDPSDVSSARIRLATETGETSQTLDALQEVSSEKDLTVIRPLTGDA
jgi:ACT domain-containing protein